MSRYELVIENRVICSNLWEELFANSRIVCHNSSLCLYCLVERSHSSRTHARTSHPIDASSLTIMKFTSWLRNITRVDSLCPNGCPRANSRMDRYSVEPRPFLFPLASFSPYTDDIVTSCVILLISSRANEWNAISLSSFFLFFRRCFVGWQDDNRGKISFDRLVSERWVYLCSRIGPLIIDPYHWILFSTCSV